MAGHGVQKILLQRNPREGRKLQVDLQKHFQCLIPEQDIKGQRKVCHVRGFLAPHRADQKHDQRAVHEKVAVLGFVCFQYPVADAFAPEVEQNSPDDKPEREREGGEHENQVNEQLQRLGGKQCAEADGGGEPEIKGKRVNDDADQIEIDRPDKEQELPPSPMRGQPVPRAPAPTLDGNACTVGGAKPEQERLAVLAVIGVRLADLLLDSDPDEDQSRHGNGGDAEEGNQHFEHAREVVQKEIGKEGFRQNLQLAHQLGGVERDIMGKVDLLGLQDGCRKGGFPPDEKAAVAGQGAPEVAERFPDAAEAVEVAEEGQSERAGQERGTDAMAVVAGKETGQAGEQTLDMFHSTFRRYTR